MKIAKIIYPGEMWGKRVAHLITISAIGFTLFLGHVQSDLISRSVYYFIMDQVQPLSQGDVTIEIQSSALGIYR